jgi:hypothetical protein
MKWVLRIFIGILVLIVTAGLLFYFIVYNKPHVDYSIHDADVEIKAEELYKEYVKNPLAAAKKYNGKVLIVTGEVSHIETSDDMVIAVMVFDEGFFGPEGIRFTLLADQQDKVSVESKNSIKGFCSGYSGSDVIIEHASVINGDN